MPPLLTLRLPQASDADACAAIYAPYVRDTTISFELEPPSATEMGRRMADVAELAPWLVAEADGRVVGYAYGSRFRARPAYAWSVEVSVYVDAGAHRRGVGRALYRALLAGLCLQGFHSALAGIALPNPASVRLHEALGFVAVGSFPEVGYKHGRWWDVGFWRLGLTPPPSDDDRGEAAPPTPPRPVQWLRTQPAWLAAIEATVGAARE